MTELSISSKLGNGIVAVCLPEPLTGGVLTLGRLGLMCQFSGLGRLMLPKVLLCLLNLHLKSLLSPSPDLY